MPNSWSMLCIHRVDLWCIARFQPCSRLSKPHLRQAQVRQYACIYKSTGPRDSCMQMGEQALCTLTAQDPWRIGRIQDPLPARAPTHRTTCSCSPWTFRCAHSAHIPLLAHLTACKFSGHHLGRASPRCFLPLSVPEGLYFPAKKVIAKLKSCSHFFSCASGILRLPGMEKQRLM